MDAQPDPRSEVDIILDDVRADVLNAFEWLGMAERADVNINYEFGKTLGEVSRVIIERTLRYAREHAE